MSEPLAESQVQELEAALRARLQTLLEETRQILIESDEESYTRLAGEVHDTGEQSVADLLVDLDLADVDRHVEEIRDVEAALRRIAVHSYGVCSDCGEAIAYARLKAYPTAKRCIRCQQKHERSYREPGRPSL
ncbi:C4-type zinc finger protein, DksA/TraR family [Thioalkalivibrio nitratireducens DSM 14787]|uniref:C4-type zinc finger protein, DksA/TraR family n=1 Tax=Thioalkalivibrio nitratireducens (strain DSM 14787 / UNIQEM 213 / ALEN2) TaxID=1255043 RepID=L0DVX9_THIND|nr:TraR/DksA family transcriptional regulator [Thioalkalivibrio nitratireducens]AGA33172.1 C4-type zinc finger protein, DksA/TraR family [Thioalkalivibrio nitratireducens DSM 14787]